MRNIIVVFLLLGFSGCIKPFEPDVDPGEKQLVVNGLITNEPGPYSVKINKTTPYGGYFSDVDESVLGAEVRITDELGAVEVLKEIRPGEFRTSATGIRGRINGTYILKIKLQNGEEYASEPEIVKSVPPIDRFYYQVKESSYIDENKNVQSNPYLDLQIDAKDPAGERNFYKWVSVGTYEVETQPEDFMITLKNGSLMSAPKSCCKQCWLTRVDNTVHVLSDYQINGKDIIGQSVGSIPITPRYLGIKYRLELMQLSISENAYRYWSMLGKQASGTGSVQDPAPANPKGNIFCTSDPKKKPLGIFSASCVIRNIYWIKRQDLTVPVGKFIYPDDCRALPGATTNRPVFWQ